MPCMYEWIRIWNQNERKRKTEQLLTEHLISKVDEALRSFGCDAISVDYNELTGKLDINRCGGSWSYALFPDVAEYDALNLRLLTKELDERSVGYCLR